MMRSLYSGVSGLKNHQTRMDVIGNNIANVNTIGFKSSRVVFQDIYSQTAAAASGPSATSGGTNAIQIGLGVRLAAIDNLHTSSSNQRTDAPLDVMINGEGFFIIQSSPTSNMYTRAGNFYLDANDKLVTASGQFVMGTNLTPPGSATPTGTVGTLQPVTIPAGYSDVSIDSDGVVWGINDSTNKKEALARLAIATFSNNAGLEKVGNSQYRETASSGTPVSKYPGEGGAGALNPGGLEMSNVDIAAEMTDMIVTQRGFQANSRVITTSDSMLEELVNLKR